MTEGKKKKHNNNDLNGEVGDQVREWGMKEGRGVGCGTASD